MILHTVYPTEAVLEGCETYSPEYLEIEYEDFRIIVEMLSPDTGKIVRVISPVADNYLNPALQPGVLMSFNINSSPAGKRE